MHCDLLNFCLEIENLSSTMIHAICGLSDMVVFCSHLSSTLRLSLWVIECWSRSKLQKKRLVVEFYSQQLLKLSLKEVRWLQLERVRQLGRAKWTSVFRYNFCLYIFLASNSLLLVPFTNCFSLYRLAPKLCIRSMLGLSWSSTVQSILF